MKITTARALVFSFFISLIGTANGAILSGSVSFDSNTGLYTYSYSLDNTTGPATLNELSVIIDSSQNRINRYPLSYTEPSGTGFGIAVSGTSADPPLNEFGIIWDWSMELPVGNTLSGFSFTTAVVPVSGTANNYFLWSSFYTGGPPLIGGGGIVEYGHIVAPDYGATVPIPAAFWLFGSGLIGMLGFMRRRVD